MGRRSAARAATHWGVPAGLFALAVAVRALPYPTIVSSERVTFFGMDAYYHMRRVLYGLARFPETLSFDPYINFPHGAKPIWPLLFDGVVTWLVFPFYAAGGELQAERAAVWLPPLLGGLTVVVLYVLALRFFGFAVALLAGGILCLLPGHFWYSQIGFVDHHAAVALVSTCLLAAAMRLVVRLAAEPADRLAPAVVATGLAIAIALLLWPGSLLHVALVEAALLVHLLTRATREEACRSAGALAAVHGLAFAVVLPFTAGAAWPQWGDFSPAVLSRFQPWLLGSLTLPAAACWVLWRRADAGADRRRGHVLVSGALVLVASVVAFPGLLEGASDAWLWLAKQEDFQARVAESQPLFEEQGRFSTRIAELRLSRFLYLLPLALVAMAWRARRRPDREAVWLLVGWTAGLAAVTLVQKRFFNSLSVSLALAFGWSVVAVYGALSARARFRAGRFVSAAAVAAAALLLLAPTVATYRVPLENLVRATRGEPLRPRPSQADLQRAVEAALWIRDHTPATAGFLDAGVKPEWGILSLSGVGHVLEYVARRPTLTNNFGDDIGRENYDAVRQFLAARDEREADRIAWALRARYVMVSVPTVPGGRVPVDPPMQRRLAEYDGRGLGGYRLLFEGAPPAQTSGHATPYKVFERVFGAHVIGRAQPDAPVAAYLELRTNRGRPLTWRSRVRADAQGSFTFRLPYANRGGPPAVEVADHYRIESGPCRGTLQIDEGQLTGKTVHLPDLCSEPAPGAGS